MSNILNVTHNSGLFSCHTQALQDIMKYWNYHQEIPDVQRGLQYVNYKAKPTDNLIPMLFKEWETLPATLEPGRQYFMSNDPREQQFTDYRHIRHDDLKPFIENWFTPSEQVTNRVYDFKSKYKIDPDKTLAVFHRANDKVKETDVASIDDWNNIIQGEAMSYEDVLLIPDNIEMRDSCTGVKVIEENPVFPADEGACTFMKLPFDQRPAHALNFFATVLLASQCRGLVTHSGNGSWWTMLYRGHSNNVVQFLNGEWLC